MTFAEAFNSGCRFRISINNPRRFVDHWWWQKKDLRTCTYGYLAGGGDYVGEAPINAIPLAKENFNDWELYPEDEREWRFRTKLETIVDAD